MPRKVCQLNSLCMVSKQHQLCLQLKSTVRFIQYIVEPGMDTAKKPLSLVSSAVNEIPLQLHVAIAPAVIDAPSAI